MVEEWELDTAEEMLSRMDLEHILYENDLTEAYVLAILINMGEVKVET